MRSASWNEKAEMSLKSRRGSRRAGAIVMASGMVVVAGMAGMSPARAGDFQVIAKTNDAVPGFAGARYLSFGLPVINSSGAVAFTAPIIGPPPIGDNISAVFTGMPGALSPVLKRGDRVPGLGDTLVSPVGMSVNLNDAGRIAIDNRLEGTQTWARLMAGAGEPLALAVATDDPAPGVPGATLGFVQEQPAQLGDGDRTGVLTFMRGSTTGSGVWVGSPGDLRLVARAGDAAPGLPGTTMGQLGRTARFGNDGTAVFTSGLTGAVTGSALWIGGPGAVELLARSGVEAPGAEPGVVFQSFDRQTLNDAGIAVFNARVTGGGTTSATANGIWRGTTSGLDLVKRGGQEATAAGPGVQHLLLDRRMMNAMGDLTFYSTLIGDGVTIANDQGLFVTGPSGERLIAREGDAAPSLPGYVFTSGLLNAGVEFNDRGQAVFMSTVQQAGVGTLEAIFGSEIGIGTYLIAAEGGAFEVAPGDVRTIEGITWAGVGTGMWTRALNNSGELVLGLSFTDGTDAVVTTVIPAPPVLGLLGLAAVGRRKRG